MPRRIFSIKVVIPLNTFILFIIFIIISRMRYDKWTQCIRTPLSWSLWCHCPWMYQFVKSYTYMCRSDTLSEVSDISEPTVSVAIKLLGFRCNKLAEHCRNMSIFSLRAVRSKGGFAVACWPWDLQSSGCWGLPCLGYQALGSAAITLSQPEDTEVNAISLWHQYCGKTYLSCSTWLLST